MIAVTGPFVILQVPFVSAGIFRLAAKRRNGLKMKPWFE